MKQADKLIYACDALNEIKKLNDLQHFGEWYVDYEGVLNVLEKAPAVDAVAVIRCKDCIYYHRPLGMGFGKCNKAGLFPYDDDFCSNGERKT